MSKKKRDLAQFNAISHGYFGIDEEEVWGIIQNRLQPLVKDILEITQNSIDLSSAIDAQILDYERLKDYLTVEFLQNFFYMDKL